MRYESIRRWVDFEDRHLYNAGDAFPHDGRQISEARIAELSGTQNKAGFAVIKATQEADEKKPTEEDKTPRRAAKGRKKAT